ncbi:hypothetical protein JT359_12295 [Candidatus Poribacteria bacterium]|nr:hypothetical protein [Candidatus Poribacteria bacterium]
MNKYISLTTLIIFFVGIMTLSVFGHGEGSTLLEDVNNDGIVNIQDLVLVANSLGEPGDRNAEQNPDVNRDGTVNILDLVRVANSFGATKQNDNSTYHDIQDNVFDKSCANSVCHAPPSNSAALNLTYGQSYHDLVDRIPRNPAAAAAGMKLIDPGNPDNSFLLTKLIGPENPEFGGRMPFGGGTLHNGKIEAIKTWIEAGAPQNGKVPGVGDLGVLRDPDEIFEAPLPPAPGEGYQLQLPPFKIEPGTEREVFYAAQLLDHEGEQVEGDIYINRVEIFYPSGSHHFILYRLTEEGLANGVHKRAIDPSIGVNPEDEFRDLDPDDPQALGNFGVDRLFVVGTQTDDTLFEFPEGVGLRVPGDTVFDLNSHYINLLGDETLIGETYVNIYTIPEEEVKYEAVEIFVSNRQINVPPDKIRVSKLTWYVEDEIVTRGHDSDAELYVFLLTSHMHRHGELFEIFQKSTGDLLHRSIAYDDAPITIFDSPVILNSEDGISFQCTFNNYDKNEPLQFGLTSEDEMCIIFGYYYIPIEKAGHLIQ